MKIRDINKTTIERLQKQDKAERARRSRTGDVPASGNTTALDQVSISARSREIQKLEEVIANTPDVREKKVAELKEKIEQGNYEVDPGEIARRILAEI